MARQDEWVRITLRLPREVHEKLTGALDDTNRSMNAEIVARLEETFAFEQEGVAMTREAVKSFARKSAVDEVNKLRSELGLPPSTPPSADD